MFPVIYSRVCTDFSGKNQHRKVGMGTVVASGNLVDVMVIKQARNARDVGPITTLAGILLIFTTPTILVSVTVIMYKLHTV